MTLIGLLLMLQLWAKSLGWSPVFQPVCAPAVPAVSILYFSRFSPSRFFAWFVVALWVVGGGLAFVWVVAGLVIGGNVSNSELLTAIASFVYVPVVGSIVFSSLFFAEPERGKGVLIGLLMGLAVGRNALLILPGMRSPYGEEATLASLIPLLGGGLIGVDLGTIASRRPGLLRSRILWSVLGVVAIVGIVLRVG